MSNFLNKFKDVLLGVDIEDDEEEYIEEYEYEEPQQKRGLRQKPTEITAFERSRGSTSGSSYQSSSYGGNKVVDISSASNHSSKRTQVSVCSPKSIEDARIVITNTKSLTISIINLEGVDNASAQRIADFLSGSVDALEASIKRLSDEMFLIAPNGVNITSGSDLDKEIKSSVNFTWLNGRQ